MSRRLILKGLLGIQEPLDEASEGAFEYSSYEEYFKAKDHLTISPVCKIEKVSRHVTPEKFYVEILAENLVYRPGQSIGVHAPNRRDTVDQLLGKFKERNQVIVVRNDRKVSLFDYLLYEVDLLSFPSKSLIAALSKKALSHSDALNRLVLPASRELLDRLRAEKISLSDFLLVFSFSCPLSEIAPTLPLIAPRFYSISNAPGKSFAGFCFSLVEGGHCTTWLAKESPSAVAFSLNPSQKFCLQKSINPVILVGPGTGVSPYLAFLEEIYEHWPAFPKIYLYYGCKSADSDFLFKAELEAYQQKKDFPFALSVAFSQDPTARYHYVQDAIKEHSATLASLILAENATVYVCGDGMSMAKQVMQTFIESLARNGSQTQTEHESRLYLDQMAKSGRYLQDVWS